MDYCLNWFNMFALFDQSKVTTNCRILSKCILRRNNKHYATLKWTVKTISCMFPFIFRKHDADKGLNIPDLPFVVK